jgi:endo-1,4-beta-mannosidase
MGVIPAGVRGFNYQPSYGSTGLELWMRFDPDTIRSEIALGKRYFPGMNAIRLWLSWDAFHRDPQRFLDNLETTLAILAAQGLPVMPVLFNRWHDGHLDYGGVYVDHLLGRMGGVVRERELFADYVNRVVGGHARDSRVFCWDLCNEPNPIAEYPAIEKTELDWLAGLYAQCKSLGAAAPVTIGSHFGCPLVKVEPFSDWLSIHPYLFHDTPEDRSAFRAMLDGFVALARQVGKPLLATETCWGSLSDEARAKNARFTLAELKQRGIGWLVYLLHHSLIADAHRPEFGLVGAAGNLAFIEADGTLRPGHQFFNEY